MFLLSVENLEKTEKGKRNDNNKNPTFMGRYMYLPSFLFIYAYKCT